MIPIIMMMISIMAMIIKSADPPVRREHRRLDYLRMNNKGMKRVRERAQGPPRRAPRRDLLLPNQNAIALATSSVCASNTSRIKKLQAPRTRTKLRSLPTRNSRRFNSNKSHPFHMYFIPFSYPSHTLFIPLPNPFHTHFIPFSHTCHTHSVFLSCVRRA